MSLKSLNFTGRPYKKHLEYNKLVRKAKFENSV